MKTFLTFAMLLFLPVKVEATPPTHVQLPPAPKDLNSTIVETKLIINFKIEGSSEEAKPKQTEFFQPIHIKKIEKVTKTT